MLEIGGSIMRQVVGGDSSCTCLRIPRVDFASLLNAMRHGPCENFVRQAVLMPCGEVRTRLESGLYQKREKYSHNVPAI